MKLMKFIHFNKSYFLSLFLFFASTFAFAQVPNVGAPFISNFDSKSYKAHNQNWSAVQDARGVVYIGNSLGVLEFDGQRWDLIPLKGNGTVRALSIAKDGTIFYGSIGEFGYLKTSPTGQITAVALNNLIPAEGATFNDIWQIEITNQGVYFFTRASIYRYHDGKVTILPGKLANSQVVMLNDTIFYADSELGLSLIDGEKIQAIVQLASVYNGQRIALTPFGTHEILVGRLSGDFLRLDLSALWDAGSKKYKLQNAKQEGAVFVHPFVTEMDAFLQSQQAYVYKLLPIDKDTFAMATIKAGIFTFDRTGKILRVINKNSGLIDNVVLGVMRDRSKNLWALTNLGVSHVELSVPQSMYGANNGIDGMAVATQYYKGRLYVGTFQDALVQAPFQYSIVNNTPKFVQVKNAGNGVWDFMEVEGDLMAATSEGLYQFEGDSATRITGTTRTAYVLGTSPKWPKHLFVGLLGGVQVFKKIANQWIYVDKLKEITDNIRNITTDQYGDLWLVSDVRGLIRTHFSGASPTDVDIHYFGKKQGTDDLKVNRLILDKTHMYLLTSKGLLQSTLQAWQENVAEDSDPIVFSPDLKLGNSFQNPPMPVQDMIADGKGGYIIAAEVGVSALTWDKEGQTKTSTYAFRGLDSPDGVFYRHPEGGFWLPGKGLFRVDPWDNKNYQQSFETLIRKVMTNNKQALFEGAYGENGKSVDAQPTVFLLHQNKKYTPELAYINNALSFEFAASFFEKPGTTLFQYKLEGFDKEWSNWDHVASKEYTNIPEGTYTFRVRSKNLYDTMGEDANYKFVILPPWYRTIWAYLLWITLFCAGLVGLIQFYTFRLKRDKILLEEMVAERTQQLRDATLTDPLTGLRNRRFISEVLQSDIAAFVGYKNYLIESESHREGMTGKEVFGLFLLDMDHFKHVNDTYGHEAGDQLLKQFAQILLASVREDDVVIRLGGEEFLVVLKKTNPDFIHDFAQKLLKKVAETDFDLGEGSIIHKTCSIGYTTFPVYHQHPDLVSFDQGVMIADMAMYHAKHQGRNQAIFLHEGEKLPKTEEGVQKVATSMEFAINGEYLAIGKTSH